MRKQKQSNYFLLLLSWCPLCSKAYWASFVGYQMPLQLKSSLFYSWRTERWWTWPQSRQNVNTRGRVIYTPLQMCHLHDVHSPHKWLHCRSCARCGRNDPTISHLGVGQPQLQLTAYPHFRLLFMRVASSQAALRAAEFEKKVWKSPKACNLILEVVWDSQWQLFGIYSTYFFTTAGTVNYKSHTSVWGMPLPSIVDVLQRWQSFISNCIALPYDALRLYGPMTESEGTWLHKGIKDERTSNFPPVESYQVITDDILICCHEHEWIHGSYSRFCARVVFC